MEKKYYLAYGSNLNVQQMKRRCPHAEIVGTGLIQDHELLFRGEYGCSYLTIEESTGETVPVAVWTVDETDEEHLDWYEGFPELYYKTEMDLSVQDMSTGETRKLTAFVYIMQDGYPQAVPSPLYMESCQQGYADFGFEERCLLEALERAEESA